MELSRVFGHVLVTNVRRFQIDDGISAIVHVHDGVKVTANEARASPSANADRDGFDRLPSEADDAWRCIWRKRFHPLSGCVCLLKRVDLYKDLGHRGSGLRHSMHYFLIEAAFAILP